MHARGRTACGELKLQTHPVRLGALSHVALLKELPLVLHGQVGHNVRCCNCCNGMLQLFARESYRSTAAYQQV